jgi:hypothetical protein
MIRYMPFVRFSLGCLLLVSTLCSQQASGDVNGIISDILDYQLNGAQFPVQYLYDDTQPNPQYLQVPDPIVTVTNPGLVAPREVWLMRPGEISENPNDLSGISDIVAVTPIVGNQLALHFWSDDPITTAAQFRQGLGLAGPPAGTILEDLSAHDVNALLFANTPSPFQHVIVASDVLPVGVIPGGGGGGGGGGIGISETFAFRDPNGSILNQGGHGATMYDGPGIPEYYNDVYTINAVDRTFATRTIGFTEGAFPDLVDPTADPITDTVTLRVTGGNPGLNGSTNCTAAAPCTLTFEEWSEDPTHGHPPVDLVFDETKPHAPLADLLGVRGVRVGTDGQGNPILLNQIDFKSDPPAPEPATLILFVVGVAGLLVFCKSSRS